MSITQQSIFRKSHSYLFYSLNGKHLAHPVKVKINFYRILEGLSKRKEEKDGNSKVGSRGRSGSVCLAAALI